MRNREEIEEESVDFWKGKKVPADDAMLLALQLEVLLDIRELLQARKDKEEEKSFVDSRR